MESTPKPFYDSVSSKREVHPLIYVVSIDDRDNLNRRDGAPSSVQRHCSYVRVPDFNDLFTS